VWQPNARVHIDFLKELEWSPIIKEPLKYRVWIEGDPYKDLPLDSELRSPAGRIPPIRTGAVVPRTGLWRPMLPLGHPEFDRYGYTPPMLRTKGEIMKPYGVAGQELLWYWLGDPNEKK
jgi:hypothetical protein